MLDAAFADAMKALAAKYPKDDHVLTMYAQSAMDTPPWDRWQAAGAKPAGRAQKILLTAGDGAGLLPAQHPLHPGLGADGR